MRKLIIGIAICGLAVTSAFSSDVAEREELTKKINELLQAAPTGAHGGKVVTPEIRELMNRRSGGLVFPRTNGRTFLLVDARAANDDYLKENVGTMRSRFHLGFTPVEKVIDAKADLFAVAQGLKTKNNPAVIMLVDRQNAPVLSIYPEEAIGIVNSASLKTADRNLFKSRLTKELWRCIGLAFGNGLSAAPNGRISKTILSPIHSVKELDELIAVGLGPAQANAVYEGVSSLGLQAARPTIYSIACRQGWAPAPTNDIQKAIWDKVHEVPKNPMKIEFDPKKGR